MVEILRQARKLPRNTARGLPVVLIVEADLATLRQPLSLTKHALKKLVTAGGKWVNNQFVFPSASVVGTTQTRR